MTNLTFASIIASLGAVVGRADTPVNLVTNPSFERPGNASAMPDSWNGDWGVYSPDLTVRHTGRASLKFVGTNLPVHQMCSQKVVLPPGLRCISMKSKSSRSKLTTSCAVLE